MPKYCVYRSCKSRESLKKGERDISYFPVPKPSMYYEKCIKWLGAISREELNTVDVKKHHYVCSKHFDGGNGPTIEHPDPIKDIEETERNDHPSSDIVENTTRMSYHPNTIMDGKETVNFRNIVLCGLDNLPKTETVEATEEEYFPQTDTMQAETTEMELFTQGEKREEEIIKEESEIKSHTDNYTIITPDLVDFSILQNVKEEQRDSERSLVSKEITETWKERDNDSIVTFSTNCKSDTIIDVEDQNQPFRTLEQVAREYLIHQANNINSIKWIIEIKREENVISALIFKCNEILKVFLKSTFICEVTFCGEEISGSHRIFQSAMVNLKTPVQYLGDLVDNFTELESWSCCLGITGELFDYFRDKYLASIRVCSLSQSLRSEKCEKLFRSSRSKNICPNCRLSKQVLQKRRKRGNSLNDESISKHTNLKYFSESHYKNRIDSLNAENAALKSKLKKLESKIKTSLGKKEVLLTAEESADFEHFR